jgi:hypothetical protein
MFLFTFWVHNNDATISGHGLGILDSLVHDNSKLKSRFFSKEELNNSSEELPQFPITCESPDAYDQIRSQSTKQKFSKLLSDPSASRTVVTTKPHPHTNTSLVDITQSLNDHVPNDTYLNRFFPIAQVCTSRKMSQGSSGLGTMTSNFASLSQSGENNDENLSAKSSNNSVNNGCTNSSNSNESKIFFLIGYGFIFCEVPKYNFDMSV